MARGNTRSQRKKNGAGAVDPPRSHPGKKLSMMGGKERTGERGNQTVRRETTQLTPPIAIMPTPIGDGRFWSHRDDWSRPSSNP